MRKAGSMTRRDFLKGAAVGAVGIATAGVFGDGTRALAENAGSASEETTKNTEPTDGRYLTKVMGHENWIYVSTVLREGKIVECKVLNHEETMGIGNFACARIPAMILENQSIDVPNVRGCSITSMAIKSAVKEAIEISGYNVDDFSAPIKRVVENETVTKDCDVVVVGAGASGLITAARLAYNGYSVIVLEKKDIPGGTMPMTYSSLVAAESERLAEAGSPLSLETTLTYWKSKIRDEFDEFDKAAPYMTARFEVSGKCCDWLNSIGVGFMPIGSYEGGITGSSAVLAPGIYEGGAGYAAMHLANYINLKENCEIIYNAQVDSLVADENGRYTGVTAKTFDADEGSVSYTVNAKAVALCAGGFARNATMIEEYYPQYAGQFFNCNSGSTGEVIQMAVEAGAGLVCMGRDLPAYPAAYYSKFELAFITYNTPGIMVNVKGNKICNPNFHNHQTMAEIKVDPENEDTFYWITDAAGAQQTRHYMGQGFDGYKALYEREMDAFRFDSVAACAEELNLENLASTLDSNNEYAIKGEADEWGYSAPYIETSGEIWAYRIDPNFYLTTGGISADPVGHVLNGEDGSIIPGLYVAGDTGASPEEHDGATYGEGFSMAVHGGFVLAETLSNEL